MTSCIDACDYYDYSTMLRSKVVTARKAHKCGECSNVIQPGSKYLNEAVVTDGHASTHKTCARCANVRRDYFHSWTYGGMTQDFMDAHGFDYRDGIPPDFAPCKEVERSEP